MPATSKWCVELVLLRRCPSCNAELWPDNMRIVPHSSDNWVFLVCDTCFDPRKLIDPAWVRRTELAVAKFIDMSRVAERGAGEDS